MKNYFIITIALFSFLIIITSCNSDDATEILAPSVTSETTNENVEVTYTTIKINGNVSSDGGSEIIARGVCWNTNPNPTITDNKTTETLNTFTSTISNLVANTTYYFRVYATNSVGTSYTTEQSFSTMSLDDTTWDFLITYSSGYSYHADVVFNADGTTVYDEPAEPGAYLTNGTWSLNGNNLIYSLDGTSNPDYYYFTGTLSENTMSGNFTINGTNSNTWSAVKY
jgi:hypothetical protein